MRQEYKLGQLLKDLYVDKYKLLNSSYLLKEVNRRHFDLLWKFSFEGIRLSNAYSNVL